MILKLLIFNAVFLLHPLHVTLTTVSQDKGSDTLKVFFRMYLDDFERDYMQYSPGYKPAGSSGASGLPAAKLGVYFNGKVRIYVNRKLLRGTVSKVTVDSYELRMELFYLPETKAARFRITNGILTGIYSDQANMVYININGYEDAVKLTADHPEETVNLK